MDTGSANSRRQSYGVNSKGVIAGKPYHVWTPLPAAPYSCVNITVQAVNEQTWFKEQITEQKQPMPFKGSTLSYQSSINRSVDRSCCMYLLASHCLKFGCYVPAWYGTIYKRTKKLAKSEYLQDLLVDFSGSDKYLLSFITLPECVVLFFQWFLQTMFHYERQCWTLGYTWNAHMAWASDMDHKLCCHEKQCHE